MEPAPTDPFGLVGTILDGQYRIDAVVGEGGFGVVYRGYHLTFEQPVAIKALKLPELDTTTQNSVLAKFRDEAKLLYVLSQASLNIVRSIGFGAVSTPRGTWAPFVVLEWLSGRSLAEDLEARRAAGQGERSLQDTITLLEPAVRGLIAAHHQRVAHRDVKPANFFITQTGDFPPKPTVKVLDFGIAKVVMGDGEAPQGTGFVSFTPFYAAPEQLDPRLGPTGLHTDVYSFALVFVEVLTGRPPVDSREVIQVVMEATDPTRRPTPRRRGAAVPDAVEHVFQRALAIDPRGRHANIEQMWDALLKAAATASPTGTLAIPSVGRVQPRVPTQPMQASTKAAPPAPGIPSLGTPASNAPGMIPPMAQPPPRPPWTAAYPPAQNYGWIGGHVPPSLPRRPGPPRPDRVHWAVWLGVGLGLVLFVLICVSLHFKP